MLEVSAATLLARVGRVPGGLRALPPFDDLDESVSMEAVPSSEAVPGGELCTTEVGELGRGGKGVISAGASSPFFVVDEFELGPKRRLAFGAEATRRMNLDAAEDAEEAFAGGELVGDWEKCDPDADVIDCLNVRVAGDCEVGDAVSWSVAMPCASPFGDELEPLKLLLESLVSSLNFSGLRAAGAADVGVDTAVVVEDKGE